eukprot:9483908-Pyramimonas_sp.AAC.2
MSNVPYFCNGMVYSTPTALLKKIPGISRDTVQFRITCTRVHITRGFERLGTGVLTDGIHLFDSIGGSIQDLAFQLPMLYMYSRPLQKSRKFEQKRTWNPRTWKVKDGIDTPRYYVDRISWDVRTRLTRQYQVPPPQCVNRSRHYHKKRFSRPQGLEDTSVTSRACVANHYAGATRMFTASLKDGAISNHFVCRALLYALVLVGTVGG